MKLAFIILFLVVEFFNYAQLAFPQDSQSIYLPNKVDSGDDQYDYIITNSLGMNFDKSRPTLYLNIFRRLNQKIFLGVRGGIYNNKEDIDSLIYNTIIDKNRIYSPGFYETIGSNILVEGNVHVIAIHGLYLITENISGIITAGIKIMPVRTYESIHAEFTVSENSISSFNYNLSKDYTKKNVSKLYCSAGVNYNINLFHVGVFADNMFSGGITAGFSF